MDHNSFKTYTAKPSDISRTWYVVDAENQVVGRLASQIAHVLRGKHKPSFTPHMDTGDYVVVVNADKVRFTGQKETQKEYFRHTGYPGGGRVRTPKEVRVKKPEFIVQNAVKGMLPKGPLGRQMLRKLKVYAGEEHPHAAQQPEPLDLQSR
jgi:large subunit ribosomal protein L13